MGFSVLSSSFEQCFYTGYFLFHILLTIFIDSTICLPAMTDGLEKLVNWHVYANNDFLLLEKPSWLFWMVVVELIFQLPAFFYFVKNMGVFKTTQGETKDVKAVRVTKRQTMSTLLRLYGWNASLTSLYCIWVIYQRGYYPDTLVPLSAMDTAKLIAYYTPTFMIPLRLCML